MEILFHGNDWGDLSQIAVSGSGMFENLKLELSRIRLGLTNQESAVWN